MSFLKYTHTLLLTEEEEYTSDMFFSFCCYHGNIIFLVTLKGVCVPFLLSSEGTATLNFMMAVKKTSLYLKKKPPWFCTM